MLDSDLKELVGTNRDTVVGAGWMGSGYVLDGGIELIDGSRLEFTVTKTTATMMGQPVPREELRERMQAHIDQVGQVQAQANAEHLGADEVEDEAGA